MIYYDADNLKLIFILLIDMSILLLSDDILKRIASFIIRPKYKLLDWIFKDTFDWVYDEILDWSSLSKTLTRIKCLNKM